MSKFATGPFLREWWIDISLFIAAIACFSMFTRGSINSANEDGSDAVLATLLKGNADRKANGASDFRASNVGDKFYNLDVVWVGPKKSAELGISENRTLKLPELSLIVIKRPFKDDAVSGIEEQLEVIQGRALVFESGKTAPTRELTNTFDEDSKREGDPAKKQAKDLKAAEEAAREKIQTLPDALKFLPEQNSVLFYMTNEPTLHEVSVHFAFNKKMTGLLNVRDIKTGQTFSFDLFQQDTFKTNLVPNQEYDWSVLDSQSAVIAGPFHFEIQLTRPSDLKAEIKKALDRNKNPSVITD